MAAFEQELEIEQSPDCKSITVRDLSTWIANDEGYLKSNFVRRIDLFDGHDVVVAFAIFDPEEDEIILPLTNDIVAKFKFTITGAANFTIERTFALTCFVDLLFESVTRKDGCACSHKETNNALNNSRNLLMAAITNTKYGEHELAQDKIQKAAIILEDHNCKC